jgi:MOSC domain-containing protein YiiM
MIDALVFQINISDGGVPKRPVREAEVMSHGLDGDRQRNLKHHGGPDRALCLFSLERIIALQAEGHPIFPGSLGENLTVAGLPWEELGPGSRLRLGPEVIAEITSYTAPCATIAASFADGQFIRASQEQHPGWSRLYARVLSTGSIRIGDRASVD